jgi:gamma-glutamylcyclotransferase (GGCT)/AIG2-like uncharacterized protein YtfP
MKDLLVFVYGTLKRGNRLSLNLVDGAEFVGKAMTTEPVYNMTDLGAFPAVYPDLQGYNIKGEVFKVTPAVLETLDMIEGYPDFYTRTLISTSLGEAWMYVIEDIDIYSHNTKSTIVNVNDTLTWYPKYVDTLVE